MIQPWSEAYAEGAREVIRAVYDEYGFPWQPDGYHADLYDVPGAYLATGDEFFVEVEDGRVIGTAALETFPTIPGSAGSAVEHDGKIRASGSDCSLERLYVHPDGRGKGVGMRLVRHVIERAQARGCSTMEIWSDVKFGDAHRLYIKLGAVQVGERLCDDPDNSPEIGLILRLPPL